MRIRRKTSELPQARVNVRDQVTLGFSFESDWLRIEKLLSTNFFLNDSSSKLLDGLLKL